MLPFTGETVSDGFGASGLQGMANLSVPLAELEELSPSAASAFGVTFTDPSWHIVHPRAIYVGQDHLSGNMATRNSQDGDVFLSEPAIEYPDLESRKGIVHRTPSPYGEPIDDFTFETGPFKQDGPSQLNTGWVRITPHFYRARLSGTTPSFAASSYSTRRVARPSTAPSPSSHTSIASSLDITPFSSPSSVSSPLSNASASNSYLSSPSTQSTTGISGFDSDIDIDDGFDDKQLYEVIHDKSGKRWYQCLLCPMRLAETSARKRHSESLAHRTPSYACRECGDLFTRKDARKRHEKNKHSFDPKIAEDQTKQVHYTF